MAAEVSTSQLKLYDCFTFWLYNPDACPGCISKLQNCNTNWELSLSYEKIWAASWQNQQNDLCAKQRLRSAWASAQSDQSLRCQYEESLGPWLPIDCTASLRWAHMPFCWFCHEAAQIMSVYHIIADRTFEPCFASGCCKMMNDHFPQNNFTG